MLLSVIAFLPLAVLGQAGQQILESGGSPFAQPVFKALPLGNIKPAGWFRGELELEAAGLGGHLFDFYRFVHDSRYMGGSTEYSALDEASPYWFNALVPLAFALDDVRVEAQVRHYLDYVLDHQQADGWLGFETTHQTRGLWARCLLLLGMIQYAEADPTQTDRIVDSMHRYVVLAHSMLKDNYTGLLVHGDDVFDTAGFGVGRTHEMHIPMQWLYEKDPRNNSQAIMEVMDLMIDGGVLWGADWRTFWVKGAYPEVLADVDQFNLSWVFIHGVNMAEGLRYPLAVYRNTKDEALKKQTRTAADLLATYHTSLAGTIIADEYVSDLSPNRGSELCISAEMVFSLSWIYQYLGDNDLADWAERVAFNSLPASVAPDWWSHQYVQQENQPWSRNLTQGAGLWSDVNSYANVFGLEPNYPCCTVNHPQAYPKFLANSFALVDDGLAHVYLIPGSVKTVLGGSNQVSVSVETDYPFGHDLEYTVSAAEPFSFYVRVPEWATESSTIVGPETNQPTKLSPSERGLQQVQIDGGQATFSVHFNAQPRVVRRGAHNESVGIYYGALLYSLAIEHESTASAPLDYRNETVLPGSTVDPHTHDHRIVPTSPWAVAVDPDQIRVVDKPRGGPLPNPIWDLGAPPVELRVAAVEIDWPLAFDSPDVPPANPQPKGEPFAARFVPYGSAKLHMANLPAITLPKVDLEGHARDEEQDE